MTAPLLACPAVRSAGGIAAYARGVLDALAPAPVDVLGQGVDSESFALSAHARLLGSPVRREAFAARLAREWLSRPPTTFVFAHLGLTLPLAVLPKRPGHRVIVLLHGFEAWSRLPPRRAAGLGRVDAFVCTTRYTRELFRAYNAGLFRPDAALPIIGLSAGRELERRALPPAPSAARRVVTCITRLAREEPLKGVATLLEAAQRLDPAAWEVRIVGDGDAREALAAQARALGVEDRVRFLGWVSDEEKWRQLAATDVFCLPSAQEGFGIVFLEAMASGRPCVGAAAGALPEVLSPSSAATVPFGDADRLAAELAALATRFRSGALTPEAIRAEYDARFGWTRFVEAWRGLLAA
jgi:glycosyltransferase involved in cell wall biosynthesis